MAGEKTKKSGAVKKKKGRSFGRSLIHGKLLSTNSLGRHGKIIVAIVVLLIFYMGHRYKCQTKMELIQRLEKELVVVKTERIREKSYYMSKIRESSMTERISALGLDLKIRECPPYKININE